MPRPHSLVPRTLSTLLPARVTSGSRTIRRSPGCTSTIRSGENGSR